MRFKKEYLIPFGVGLLISAILMNGSYQVKLNVNVENEARKLGMVYPSEIKVFDDMEESQND